MTEESLFIEALDLADPAERAAFLARACAGDAGLRDRLDQLLDQHRQAGSFLGRPATGPPATGPFAPGGGPTQTSADEPGAAIGTAIGPYKLLQQIGEGGMGTVYMAEQSQPVRRKVALKVIKPGMDSRSVVARFEAERQALAMMDHVNIARVFDGGTTDAGRPYFVMELVHGVPITRYCDDHHLTPRERLELFVPVCQAIQHAHQKGVIHRDIKPSNVMVTLYDGRPVPKVIDFGIAKATEQSLTERTLFTQYGAMVGTFEYMSPEQAEMSALGVDTRSDIYSLGVLLYELLTGGTPLTARRLREAAHAEIVRMIKEEEAPRPSTRLSSSGEALASISASRKTDPAKLSQLMRGELDWIVMKTLEKDRDRRYETANGLAADVRRYLNDEPVQAYPPSAAYRLRKFARRNKAALLTAACVLAAVVTVAASVGWIIRDRGAREAALDGLADRSLDEAVTLIDDAKWPEAVATVRRAEQVLAAGGRRELPPRLQDLLRDLAVAQRLEDIYGRPKEEEFYTGHELDAAYARAFTDLGIDVAALSVGEAVDRIRARVIWRELVRALDIWAAMRQKTNHRADPPWSRLLEIAEAADPDPWRTPLRQARRRGDGRALADLAAAVDVARTRPETLHLLGSALYDAGSRQPAMDLLRQAQGRYPGHWWINNQLGWYCLTATPPQADDAARFYTAAQAIRPDNPYNLVGIHLACMGKKAYAEAVRASSRAIELRPADPALWVYRGQAYCAWGRHDPAIADFTRAVEMGPRLAWAWANRGVSHNRTRQWDKAVADYSTALRLDPGSAIAWAGRGMAYGGLGQTDRQMFDYDRAIELDPKYALAWSNRGGAYTLSGDLAKALSDLNTAVALDRGYAAAWCNRGSLYGQFGDWERATAEASRAIELEPELAEAWFNRGLSYEKRGQPDKALADYSRAIELDVTFMRAWNNRGGLYLETGQAARAVADLTRALELDAKYVTGWANRGAAHDHLGQPEKAIADFSRALELEPTRLSAWQNRGLVHRKAGQWEPAARDYSRAVALELRAGEVQAAQVASQFLFGRYGEAVTGFSRLVADIPRVARSHNDLARLLATCPDARVRDPARAVELATVATRLRPADGDYHKTLGVAACDAGVWNAAVAALTRSVELRKGGDVGDWLLLALSHGRLGQPDQARPWYDRAATWMDENEKELRKTLPVWAELSLLRSEAADLLRLPKTGP